MSTYDQMSQQLDEAESTLRAAEARLGNFEALRPILAEIVGHAETADGHVVAEWSAQGLSALELDPRVMKMPSVDLAAAIRTAVGEAMQDMRDRTRAALTEAGVGIPERPSMDDTRAQLTRLRETTMQDARRTAAELDRAAALRRQSSR